MPEVSVVIVDYKSQKYLKNCIDSIKKSSFKSFEIIVVDNNIDNIGYGAGCNLGAGKAKGKYLFFLNPDTKVFPDTISKLVNFLEENRKVGIVSPLILDKDGKISKIQGSGSLSVKEGIVALSFLNKIFPKNSISKKFFLLEQDYSKPYECGVAPGSALMIRKEIFNKAGGFDEKFFLYFEESDLCKKVSELGYKIYINPRSRIIHYGAGSTSNKKMAKQEFEKSRLYYFRKHYGFLKALLVEAFARFSKEIFLLLFILTLGAILRFYKIEENLVFHGEIGQNYLDIKNMIFAERTWLLGPRTSHEWLYFGPLFYWLMAPILYLSNYNPVAGAYFFATVSSLTIIINYYFVSEMFNKKIGLISSFILAFSFLHLSVSRESRFFSLVIALIYPFIYFLKRREFFRAGIIFGLMLNFHYSVFIYLPFILIIIYTFKGSSLKVSRLSGAILPLIPLFIYDFQNGFKMSINFLTWVPYRLAGFIRLYPKNNFNIDLLKTNILGLLEFLSKSIIPGNIILGLLILISFIYVYFKSKQSRWVVFALLSSYLVLFIHGNPPLHYFYPLYPLVIIIISVFFSKISKPITILIISGLMIWNIINFFKQKPSDIVSYQTQLDIAEAITNNVQGKPFALERVGVNDQFEASYAQNYAYLLWWMGDEPRQSVESPSYTICETNCDIKGDIIYLEDNIVVYKN